LLVSTSALKTSLILLFSISSRVARKSLTISFCAFSLSVNEPSVRASWPRSTVARCSE